MQMFLTQKRMMTLAQTVAVNEPRHPPSLTVESVTSLCYNSQGLIGFHKQELTQPATADQCLYSSLGLLPRRRVVANFETPV